VWVSGWRRSDARADGQASDYNTQAAAGGAPLRAGARA
jgi:hypothetical protein